MLEVWYNRNTKKYFSFKNKSMDKNRKIFLLVAGLLLVVPMAVLAATTISNNISTGGTLTVSDAASVTGLSTLTGGFVSSASSSVAGNFQVSGALSASGTLLAGGNVTPGSDNSLDIGGYGATFRNVYASGTLEMASSTVYNASMSSTVFMGSGAAAGGRIIMKAANSATCYQLYFGSVSGGTIGIVTSTITCPNL